MPHTNTRYWTIPLTVLLFVNTVLVALAARQVGIAGDLTAAAAEAAPSASHGEQPTAQPAGAVSVPPAETRAENVPPATESSAAEYLTTEDWPTAGESGSVASGGGPLAAVVPVEAPPVDPVPAVIPPLEIPRAILVVVNPPATGGVVHFLLDGEIVSLAPGELARVLAKGSRLVQFHRGDDFGDEQLHLETGVFAFAVSDRGWTLAEAEELAAARLLQLCRPVEPVAKDQEDSDDREGF